MAPTITHTGTGQLPLGYNGTGTFNGVSIGTADASRVVVVVCYADNANLGGIPTPTGLTIGGVSAVKLHDGIRVSGNNQIALAAFALAVPTGTTADIVVTYNEYAYVGAIDVFRCLGITTTALTTASFNASSDSNLNVNLTVPASSNLTMGAVIYQGCSSGTSVSWAGMTKLTSNIGYNDSKQFSTAYESDAPSGTKVANSSISPTSTSEGLIIAWTIAGLNDYVMPSGAGSFTLSGQSVGVQADRRLPAPTGGFTLSGQNTNLIKDYNAPIATGDFVLTGHDTRIAHIHNLYASTGQFLMVGAGVTRQIIGSYTQITSESFNVAPASYADFMKKLTESFGIAPASGKEFDKSLEESFRVQDQIRRAANGVIHDVLITSAEWDEDDFKSYADSPPVGYTPFKEFFAGDYKFKKALIGVRVSGPPTGGSIGISELKHVIDVPDVRDRGSHSITTSAAETISFTKSFRAAPEVSVTWKGGTNPATPEVFDVTTTNFKVRLRDLNSPSSFVDGTISWTAEGY